MKSGNLNFM